MDLNNKSKPLPNNAKAENLKSKIDLLIMNKTKTLPPGPEDTEENIQSIQQEINNLLTSRMHVGVSPNTPTANVKTPNCPKLPMSPAKAVDSHFRVNHGTTVENVEHLLESMFQDNKKTPVKAHMIPGSAHSKSNTCPTFPTQNSNKPNTFPNNTSVTIKSTVSNCKNVEHILENMFQDSKTPEKQNSKSADPKQNVEHILESMFEEKSPKHSTRKSSTPTPRSSLSVEAIESILRTPSPENEEDKADKPSDRLNSSNNSTLKNNSTSPRLGPTRQSSRNAHFRKRSSQSTLSSHDDSSNDSTKLEIIDESINSSKESISIDDVQSSCHSTNGTISKKLEEASMPIDKVNEHPPVKIEYPSPSPSSNTKASLKEHASPQLVIKNSKGSVKDMGGIEGAKNTKGSVKEIVAVESELEKMFAGIVKEEEDKAETAELTVPKKENGWSDASPSTQNIPRSERRRSSEFFPSSPEAISSTFAPPKRKKKTKQTMAKTAGAGKKKRSQSVRRHSLNTKDTSNDSLNTSSVKKDSGVSKVSPFVRLYTNSKKLLVVNNVVKEEATPIGNQGKKAADFVPNKKMRSSAQSNLQPANRTDVVDPSWFCVFCRRGPNTPGPAGPPLGDLFGPYRIGPPQDGYLDRDDFKRRVARSPGKSEVVKKKRTISSDLDPHRLTAGLTRVTPESSNSWDSTSSKSSSVQYEIWFHEPCIIWASGVCLVQRSLLGLDESVWAALNSSCANCGESGASIGCVKSKCRASVHYSCALHLGWYLDPTTFVATCSVHRMNYVPDRYLETPVNELLL